MEIWMHQREISAIKGLLDTNKVMLEWGSGGSTINFAPLVEKYYSIEHESEWYTKVKEETSMINNLDLHLVPNNEPYNVRTKSYSQFKDYIEHIKKINKIFDIILIDGRARVFCAEIALKYLNKNGILLFHDFPLRRELYSDVLKWYDVIDIIELKQGLAILKPKKKILNIGV